MREDPQTLVVLTTLADADRARALIRTLVDAHLVACGNVVPGVTSIYRWQGAVAEEAEVLVILKTRAERWDALRAALLAEHPHEVPEVLAIRVAAGHEPYLAWVASETEETAA